MIDSIGILLLFFNLNSSEEKNYEMIVRHKDDFELCSQMYIERSEGERKE